MSSWPTGVTFVPIQPYLNTTSGTVTATVPIVSDPVSTNVYIFEVNDRGANYESIPEPSYGDVISYGEGTVLTPSAGSSNPLTVTLQLAPAALGVAYSPSYSDSGETLGTQASDNGGSSAIAQLPNSAWVLVADNAGDGVTAEFQTSVGQFPDDGPFAGVGNGILSGESPTGWVDFQCSDCGG
jgi:hypothetical protein